MFSQYKCAFHHIKFGCSSLFRWIPCGNGSQAPLCGVEHHKSARASRAASWFQLGAYKVKHTLSIPIDSSNGGPNEKLQSHVQQIQDLLWHVLHVSQFLIARLLGGKNHFVIHVPLSLFLNLYLSFFHSCFLSLYLSLFLSISLSLFIYLCV